MGKLNHNPVNYAVDNASNNATSAIIDAAVSDTLSSLRASFPINNQFGFFHSVWFPLIALIILLAAAIHSTFKYARNKGNASKNQVVNNPKDFSSTESNKEAAGKTTRKRVQLYEEVERNRDISATSDTHHNHSENQSLLSPDALELQSFNQSNNLSNPLDILPNFLDNQHSEILSQADIRFIYANLPPLLAIQQSLKLIYSIAVHGANINTFYDRMVESGPTIMILQDSKGSKFGCFCLEEWRPRHTYYGSAASFVFILSPNHACYRYNDNHNANSLSHGQYFMLAKNDFIAMGGGNESTSKPLNSANNSAATSSNGFAIWLDNSFYRGRSLFCNTFNSPCLASSVDFTVSEMEVWAFA
jgi:hypothetical protein